jgi:ABC-type Fe3+ transport system substrate-binding protein
VIRAEGAVPPRRHDFDVSADSAGFGQLAELLERATAEPAELHLDQPNRPAGYGSWLDRIVVQATADDDLVVISRSSGSAGMLITGAPDRLAILAANCRFEPGLRPGYHVHVEWFPDHLYLDESSAPTVFTFAGNEADPDA